MRKQKIQMVQQRQINSRALRLNVGKNDGNRIENALSENIKTEPVDHWAFLDEIEAPMWVDLTLDIKSTHQDKEDDWFHISHPFHQCSSLQLISAFSHPSEGRTKVDFGTQGLCSPKLPSSVSRSRGKHYKNREWGQNSRSVTSYKQHPVKNLSSKVSLVNVESKGEKETQLLCANSEIVGSEVSSVCESSCTENAGPSYSMLESKLSDTKLLSSSTATGGSDSIWKSTVTSESVEENQQKSSEVLSHVFGYKSGLLSSVRVSLRKSCVTRQASRVEVNGGRKSEGCKSSSSKSSVGSSSHPTHDDDGQTIEAKRSKDRTPDSMDIMRVSEAMKDKLNVSNVSKAAVLQVRGITSYCRRGGQPHALKYIKQQTANLKIHNDALLSNTFVPKKVNEQDALSIKVKDKVRPGRAIRSVGSGEGKTWTTPGCQIASMREKVAGGLVAKESAVLKCVRTKLVGSKGKTNGRSEVKKGTTDVQKVYFR